MSTGKRNRQFRFAGPVFSFLLFIAGMQVCNAQQVLSGSIVSKVDRSPVAGAFVYAYDGNAMTGYAISDGEGRFSVKIPSGKKLDRLTVTCLGYKSETVNFDGAGKSYDIALSESHQEIKESKVKASVVEEKGDTLSYAARAFADGTERTLADLLEKIPGLSVTSSGGVLHNGSYINKFYIEGMDLMGAGYGVVTKNLSPDNIAKVEVYKRHQPTRALAGIQHTDKSAVNIILKEDAKNTWMLTGDLIAGVSSKPLFLAKGLLTRFAKESQDLYLIKGNDIGEDIIKELTQQQYARKPGAFLVSNENVDSDFSSMLNPRRSLLSIPQEYWYDNLSGIGSFNHLRSLDDDRQLRLSLQGAADRFSESINTTEIVQFSETESMTIEETDEMTDTKYFVSGKAAYENNSKKRYLMNELSFSAQFRDADGAGTGMANQYHQGYDLPSFKAENDLAMTVRTSDKHAINLSSNTKFLSSRHSAEFSAGTLSASQDLDRMSLYSDNGVSSSFVWKGLRMNVTGGLDLEYQKTDSRLTGITGIDAVTAATTGIFRVSPNLSLGASCYVGGTEVSVNLPAAINVLTGNPVDGTFVYPTTSPSLSLKRSLFQHLTARARVSYTLSRSDVESLHPAVVMVNYRSISHLDSLARREGAQAYVGLNWEDHLAMFYAGISATAFRNSSERLASSLYSDDFTITGFRDGTGRTDAFGLSANASKFFGARAMVIEMKGGWNRTNQDLSLQNVARSYSTDAWSASMSVRTSPADWISMEIDAEYVKTIIEGDSESVNNQVTVTGMLSLRPCKPLSINTFANYLYQDVPGVKVSNTPLLKTVATWKFKKFSLVMECRNILGCKEFTREYSSTFQTLSTTTKLTGRQFLVGLRMSL